MASLLTMRKIPRITTAIYNAGRDLVKQAAEVVAPEVAYSLSGELYGSRNKWILLSVPNALVYGVYNAMNEPGIELPPSKGAGRLNAHISVIRPEELDSIGGVEKITERGKHFTYTLGRLMSTSPDGWPEMDRVWFIHVHSPELQALRRSYGLSSLPKEGQLAFHISVAVRRRGVLSRNEKSKIAIPA